MKSSSMLTIKLFSTIIVQHVQAFCVNNLSMNIFWQVDAEDAFLVTALMNNETVFSAEINLNGK